jgi:large subunit ribosomal protein L9
MEVILLERIGKLGQMGDVVRVKDGYARNFLLPKGKALRATKDNKTRFEGMKADLEARSATLKGDAGQIATKLDNKSLVVLRQASESGQLFGSVSPRDIAALLSTGGLTVTRSQIVLNSPIKLIGQYKVPVQLHPEVEITVTVNVARSEDEAQRLARGENVTVRREGGEDDEEEEAKAAAKAEAAKFFDPEVAAREKDVEEGEPAESEQPEVEAKEAKGKGRAKKKSAGSADDKDADKADE